MKLRSRIDAIDGWLQTARDELEHDAGKFDDTLGIELRKAAEQVSNIQAYLQVISDADGWRET